MTEKIRKERRYEVPTKHGGTLTIVRKPEDEYDIIKKLRHIIFGQK